MRNNLLRNNRKFARSKWGREIDARLLQTLQSYTERFKLSLSNGDLLLLDRSWYITHTGLVGLTNRRHCSGIDVQPSVEFSHPNSSRWAFKATVFKSSRCKGFVGYGDADPSNVSPLVRGAEMRVAETRRSTGPCARPTASASARLRKSAPSPNQFLPLARRRRSLPSRSMGKNGNYGGPKLRDRLCQLIRQHQLDANLVKSYAVDFCGTKTLREATREQVEAFVIHLADWAEKDYEKLRKQVLCRDGWQCQICGSRQTCRSTTSSCAASRARMTI